MAKWRLLLFLRFAGSGLGDGVLDDSQNRKQPQQWKVESLTLPQRFTESMWGCRDELPDCYNLPGLFDEDGATCRWPSAELCLSTCGQCPLVEAARQCTSLPEEMDDRMLDEHMNWAEFFHNITSPEMQEKHEHLKGARVLNQETPWIAEFPSYLTEKEAHELIRIASVEGYRDEDDLPNDIRDVSVCNCDSLRCMREPFMSELSRRTSELLGLHPNNFESMEFIEYGPGQHYRWHADEYSWKIPAKDPVAVLSGPRLLTMFYYLSDVEEGGQTAFAGPDSTGRTKRLVVLPKKGKVILWANMKDHWRFNEPAAVHAAMEVRAGRKLAGTTWIHASGFRVPELCSGRECNPRTPRCT